MTRTPDDVKKGLEYISIKDVARKLDAWEDGIPYDYVEDAAADALALIQQLQAENAEKDKRIKQLERSLSFARDLADGLKAATVKQEQELYVSEERNWQLEAKNTEKDDRIRQLEAERDAAVAGLKSNCTCPECKYFSDEIQDPCRGCKPNDSKFEWRGVQKEG